jgi:hypothetical protein
MTAIEAPLQSDQQLLQIEEDMHTIIRGYLELSTRPMIPGFFFKRSLVFSYVLLHLMRSLWDLSERSQHL